jgi:hypothetical protein
MLRLLLLCSILLLLPLPACATLPAPQGWALSELRLLDPVDDTSTPSTDILAVYTRTCGSDFEIRVDLLDLALIPDYTLQLRLNVSPGGSPWDLTVTLPAAGRPEVTPADTSLLTSLTPPLIPRLIRDPWLDAVTVRFNRLSLPRAFTLQVAAYASGDSSPSDVSAPVRTDALPPAQRAPLVFAFWDVFPAATPAQALRLWDGAHAGPGGGRHGLKNILDSAGQAGIPVTLLDLKTPSSLAALDALGLTPQILSLWEQGLLTLPDAAYGTPTDVSLGFSRRSAAGFGLPGSLFVYSPTGGVQPDYHTQFLPQDDRSHLAGSSGRRVIPLPGADEVQATPDGPSLAVRQALMAAALSEDPADLVILGGDLPRSTWGEEDATSLTFTWIASHPWIEPLTAAALSSFPVGRQYSPPPAALPAESPLVNALRSAPRNALTDSAWNTYFMLTSPYNDEALSALKANYLGQVSELLTAARWAEQPSAQNDCSQDLNADGRVECVLSDLSTYAILDPLGACLTNLFFMDGSGPHQLVGPSSQFTVGLSDPSAWQLQLGEGADPNVIPGAFSDGDDPWVPYTFTSSPGSIAFSNPDGSRIKTFTLKAGGIETSYQISDTVVMRIPLAVDPQSFYLAPSRYFSTAGNTGTNGFTWGSSMGVSVELISDAALSAQTFTDSLRDLSLVENPDFNYPAGHYLPFPLAVITLEGSHDFSVLIRAIH